MKTKLLTQIPGMTLAVLLTLLMGSAGAENRKLPGTWRVNVTIINCQSGTPLSPVIPALNTFLGNGSLLATPSRSDLNTGHGRWERTGDHTFEARPLFFRFAADGTYLGTQELTRTIQLVTPDTFTGTTTF